MLLELAVGDAYGAGFEYTDHAFVQAHNDLTRFVQHPRHSHTPGSYTDDTQMSIAVAEAMLSEEAWTPALLAQKFVGSFKRDPREGYSEHFYTFLQRIQDGPQFLAEIAPHSDKSGAAMRAAPLGVYPTIGQVIERCTVQAALTHNTPDGINAAVAAALMTHYFLYRLGPKQDLAQFLQAHVAGEWAATWRGKVGSKGWMSVRAAITALLHADSIADLLRRCIAFTGDVDTVATIALAAGSCSIEVEQNLPTQLIEGLENGAYGRDYLRTLDDRLLALVPGTAAI